jgi:DNA-binding LacI/PurR family transcriptional regulator
MEVARLAGVSRSAVSRTFTPGAYVSKETRAKVLAAAEVLGYQPNAIARSLTKNRTGIVGIVIWQLENPFYSIILEMLAENLQQQQLASLLLISSPDTMDDLISTLLSYQVDGVLLPASTISSNMAFQCQRRGIPVVLLNRQSNHDNISSVTTDNYGGGREVAIYLVAHGYRKISHIRGASNASNAIERERGFRAGLAEHGLIPHSVVTGDFTHQGGARATRQILAAEERPEAIFCANDVMAMAAIATCKNEFGLSVPEDLGIVGYDNASAASPLYRLTTVDHNNEEMAAKAVKMLVERIADSSVPVRHHVVPSLLIERSTTRLLPNG